MKIEPRAGTPQLALPEAHAHIRGMRRLDLPEIGDLSACPPWLRRAMTGYLHAMFDALRLYDASLPVLSATLRRGDVSAIVDLASGSGGPWPALARRLAAAGTPTHVTLTDLSPDPDAARRLDAEDGVGYHPGPVSALSVPVELVGMRTMFTALHHFDADEVRSILRAAQRDRVPFAAFEATHRTGSGVLTTLAIPWLVLLLMPTVRPVRPLALLLTYLPPVLPLLIWWDGFASMLRSHTADELRAIAEEIRVPGYDWRVDVVRAPGLPVRVLRLVGTPV